MTVHRRVLGFLVVCTVCCPVRPAIGQIPAFSGAEGAGAFATGGRPNATYGGLVYHVTTLDADPSGTTPGSLRYGMKNENFGVKADHWPFDWWSWDLPESYEVIPRIIVFDVGGTIDIGEVDITPLNFTIAGQTAPGGITLYGGEFNPAHRDNWDTGYWPKTNNIVLRNMSIRTHDPAEKDGLWFATSNSIADHMSMAWYTDEGLSITDSARDVTVQHSIIGPGWNNPDGDGSQLEGKTTAADISVHHNLYIHNDARNPRLGEKEGTGVEVDFRNNVVYNWNQNAAGYSVSGEPSFTNFVNNYYIGGAGNDSNDVIFQSGSTLTRIYQSGNLLDRDKDGTADGVDYGWSVFSGSESQQSTPYSVPHGVTQTPDEALDTVINYGGANWWDRNFLDERSIDQLQTYGQGSVSETGQVLSTIDQADVDAVTGAPMQTRPAGWDTDNDGMPNLWEVERGLNPDVADWDGDDDGDGYVNLEEYINEIAEWPAPDDIVWTGGVARYAEINNWSITRSNPGEADTTTHWQPSRFDNAVVNGGTVTMDAPGQHAGAVLLGTGSGDNATLEITGGWLEVEDETVGPGDGSVVIGVDAGATAAVNLSGGRLIAKSLQRGTGGAFNFTGGVLSAEEVHFDLEVAGGTVAPGASAGQTHVLANMEIQSGALEIEIGGVGSGEFDLLVVDDTLTLGGDLEIVLLDGFVPDPLDVWTVASAGALSGGFANVADGGRLSTLDGLGSFLVEYSALSNLVVLSDFAVEDNADFDGDGDIDLADLLIWQRGYGSTGQSSNSNGDANHDGTVDGLDMDVWRSSLGGSGSAMGQQAVVPEPASWTLVLVGLVLMGRGGRGQTRTAQTGRGRSAVRS